MEKPFWVLVNNSEDYAARAREVEEMGLAGLETSQVYGAPFVSLGAAAAVTERIQLASGIAMGLTRSPFETAMSALDLDRLSQGRFNLGLGTGPAHFTKGYFAMPYDKPVSRLREIIQILRHVEDGARTGEMKPWVGNCYQLEFEGYEPTLSPYRERIPVWLAALRGKMCELAGELADGLIGHPLWSVEWALGAAQDSLAVGAARAGRDPADIQFQPWVAVSIDRDSKRATRAAKPYVAYYGAFEQYHSYFEEHGFGAEATKLAEAGKFQNCMEAASLVPDEMAKCFVAAGTPDEVLERVEPLWQRATSMLVFTPYWGYTPEEFAAKELLMADTFYR